MRLIGRVLRLLVLGGAAGCFAAAPVTTHRCSSNEDCEMGSACNVASGGRPCPPFVCAWVKRV